MTTTEEMLEARIRALEAENERLDEGLREVLDIVTGFYGLVSQDGPEDKLRRINSIANAALAALHPQEAENE